MLQSSNLIHSFVPTNVPSYIHQFLSHLCTVGSVLGAEVIALHEKDIVSLLTVYVLEEKMHMRDGVGKGRCCYEKGFYERQRKMLGFMYFTVI